MHLGTVSAALLASVASASTLTPPVLPLIVRNPYLSTWLGNARDEPWTKWPMFWYGTELGFSVIAHVPDTDEAFPLLGRPQDSLNSHEKDYVARKKGYSISYPKYKGAQYDASTTNLTYALPAPDETGNDLNITLSFLSPITPTSTLRQSLPAAYVTVYVEGDFDVNIYIDVNGQWVSGYPDAEIEWALSQQKTGDDDVEGLKTWIVSKTNEITFGEYNDHSEWGQLHFTAPDDAQHQSGHAEELRQRFAKTGTLQDEIDENAPRKINDTEPVFAFSKSFKLAKQDGPGRDSVLFTISHVQKEVTQFASAVGLTRMRPLWLHWFQTEEQLIRFHYLDFSHATSLSANYSEQLRIDAHAFGGDSYVDIVALSARQALGATSFSGTPKDPKLFLKEISSNGNSQTVDVIFPSFPFFLYTQPRWATYLLEPLLEHQLAYLYPNNYSMHDLGTHFPNMTGHADGKDEYMPVEECGDMLIMALSLVNAMTHESASSAQSIWSTTGHEDTSATEADHLFPLTNLGTHNDISYIDPSFGGSHKGRAQAKQWVNRSYRLWKQWVAYLDEFARDPENQLCTDDFAGWLPLQTNLALKGIIGIKAFAHLASLTSHPQDASLHFTTATSYLAHWLKRGISQDGSRAKLSYDWNGSWTTLYSLYSDAALCFHPSVTNPSPSQEAKEEEEEEEEEDGGDDFLPHTLYTSQSTWYASSLQTFGLPLDSRHLYAKSDWEMFAAAVAGEEVRREIVKRVGRWVNETGTERAFVDLYETEGEGGFPGDVRFYARPVVGGHFAGVALRGCGGREVVGKEEEEVEVVEMDEL